MRTPPSFCCATNLTSPPESSPNLVAAHRATGTLVVASAYGGSFGVPALFARALFAELAQLEGAAGAKQVIKRYAAEAHFLPFPGGEVDVDTPDDFSRLTAEGAQQEQA
jgi:molybdenum cofactor cytidylyltransferase